jgi:DNA repair exonuclease SbcCD ATPase subunit
MEIKSITLENFRCHELYKLELGKVTVITGPNGSGKSSIIEAVATMLLGENTWTNRQGVRLGNFIRSGTIQATVSITGKRTISRVIRPKGSQLLLDGQQALTQPLLLNNMRVTEPQLRAALIPQSFLNLDLKEQKETLFNLLAKQITLEDVAKYIPQTAMRTWATLANRYEKEVLESDTEFIDLDKLYEFCFEARRNYKSTQAPVSKAPAPKSEDLVKKLSKLTTDIMKGNTINQRVAAYKKALARLPEMKKELTKLQADATKVTKGAASQKELEAEWADLSRKEAAAQALLEQALMDQRKITGAKVAKGKVECPIGLVCPHDASATKKLANNLSVRVKNLNGEIVLLETEIQKVSLKLEDAKTASKKDDDTLQASKDLESDIKEIEEQEDPGEQVDVAELKAEKARVEKDINAATRAPSAAAAADDPAVEQLTDIVNALNVNGIKTAVVRTEILALQQEIDASLKPFGGWRIRFFMDEEYRPAILKQSGEIGVGELSDGERAILSLIVQDVFSQRSNIQLVVVDNLDLLDRKNAAEFFEVATKIKSKVLVAMAQSETLEAMTLPAAVTVVSLAPAEAEPEEKPQRTVPNKPAPRQRREEELL